MEIHLLPGDISLNENERSDSIIFHHYAARKGTFKGKSILQKNAISMVISGEKTMVFADKTVEIKDDEFHFLSSGNCLASVDLSRQDLFHSILIFFDDSVLRDFYIKYSDLTNRLKPRLNVVTEPYLSFKKDKFVWNFIESLKLLFESGPSISLEMKLLKFEELMLHLLQKNPAALLSFQPSKNKSLNDFDIRNAVESNVEKNISVEELAFLCNISLSTFNRRFLKIYGIAPRKWMLQRRMDMAKNLLLHHHEKPSEVYYKVGYENHSSFSQSFKQAFGLSPKDFQAQKLPVQQQFLN